MTPVRQFLAAIALSALVSTAAAQEVSLPGNASSLSEAHGSWTVQCAIVPAADGAQTKRCSLSQQQVAQQTGQRALMIELTAENETAKGTLVLPFGLDLQQGVAYQLDEGANGPRQHFRTCLPIGCTLEIDFDADTIASLKAGAVLKVKAIPLGGQEMTFPISLAGFASAYDRVVELLQM